MNEFRDDAVVLRTYKSGEADRVVVLWTRAHGKVRVIAKGVRKSTSRLGASLETLACVNVDLVATRGPFFVARHVSTTQRLTTLRSSYERINAGYAVVEVVDAIPTDDVADEGIYDLLVRVLLALDNEAFDPTLVPASFFMKLLAYDGSAPVLDECANCQSTGPLVAFDAQVGGALCVNCRSGSPISPVALDLLRRILGGDLAQVLRGAPPEGAGEAMAITHDAIELHFGKRLRAQRSAAPIAPPTRDR